MNDQADKLRQIIDNLRSRQNTNYAAVAQAAEKKSAKVVTVTSGKGGVGKTNITINLAISLSEMGYKVIILDADLGLANIDVLFGINPRDTLVDVIHGRKSILEVLADGPKDVKFVSGGSGVEDLVKMDKEQLDNFVGNIAMLDKLADIILIDTGAGLSDSVMSFVMAADEVILVTTPEPTSITDAYALIKMVVGRDKDKVIRVVVNRAEDENEASEILGRLSMVAKRFLSIELKSLGYVLQDQMVIKAVKLQKPFTLSFPKSHASRLVREISRKLMEERKIAAGNGQTGVKGFVSRLVKFLNS
ncbi:flagellar biosynthesis protein FlhG [Anaerobacterium chartisolvens]|uniref:Flagellar biosynthesis protein FlhG n=1 Tax=Anaerobacterium chartisolvens TaxID=1297424 RepID=A0A369B1I4_9FIRM|nr:MinD/ParA family protein [Anaerobacterium chartisolvens]RCX15532.1 flagellar biosynthesis protein FlhG [Anaerobacterium chartisolvens]